MGQLHDRMKEDLVLSGYSPSTTKIYLIYARKFAKHFMRSPVEMGECEVRSFLLHLLEKERISRSTLRQIRAALYFLYTITLHRPCEVGYIPSPKKKHLLPVVLSHEEVNALLCAVHSIKYRAIIMAMYATGLRISEACQLQVGDIDSKRMLIRVRLGKGQKDRYTLLSPRLLAFLRKYWKTEKPPTWLFPGTRGTGHIHTASVRIVFKKAIELAGIKKQVSPHVLRHSFATHLLEAGVDIMVIKELLGHESIRTTKVYTHVSKKHIAGVKSPLDRLPNSASAFPD
jgi:site-specific recombinase XerD